MQEVRSEAQVERESAEKYQSMYEEVLAYSKKMVSSHEDLNRSFSELNREYQLVVRRKKETEDLLQRCRDDFVRLQKDKVVPPPPPPPFVACIWCFDKPPNLILGPVDSHRVCGGPLPHRSPYLWSFATWPRTAKNEMRAPTRCDTEVDRSFFIGFNQTAAPDR